MAREPHPLNSEFQSALNEMLDDHVNNKPTKERFKGMRTVNVNIEQVLSLVSVAETYGVSHPLIYDTCADLLEGKLSDEEIYEYTRNVTDEPPYTMDDFMEISNQLLKFKREYSLV